MPVNDNSNTKRSETHVDRFLTALKNNRLFAVVVLIGIFIIAISQFTNAVSDILDFFGSYSPTEQPAPGEETAGPTASMTNVALYGTDIATDQLLVFNLGTGRATAVGALTGPPGQDQSNTDIEGIAYHPLRGLFWGTENFTKNLVEFSTKPDGLELITPHSGGTTNLARNPVDDQFYSVAGSSLYKIDPNTGQSTFVGDVLSTKIAIEALAFSPEGRLFGIDILDDQLMEINPFAGETLSKVTISLSSGGTSVTGSSYTSLAIHPENGIFYATTLRNLYTIDPSSGTITRRRFGPTL